MLRALINRRHYKSRDMMWLEVTPPAQAAITPQATEQLFAVLHSLRASRSMRGRLLNREPVMSFEITSTKRDGIRYLVQVEKRHVGIFEKAIASYVPHAKVGAVEASDHYFDHVTDFTQTNHHILPLAPIEPFAGHDPLAYVTSAMTKLSDDTRVAVQLVVMPIRLRETSAVAHKMLRQEDVLARAKHGNQAWAYTLANGMNKILWGMTDMVGEAYNGTAYSNYSTRAAQQDASHQSQVLKGQRPARLLSSIEQELMQTMHAKSMQSHFQVGLRILASGSDAAQTSQAIRAALGGYSVPLYQSLKAKSRLSLFIHQRRKLANLRLPTLSRRHGLVLSSAELAGLYHFPSRHTSHTDNLAMSLSRTLPAPTSLKRGTKLDVLFGENIHHGERTLIGLTEQERERHEYIIGGTGNGKTTLLQYQIVQDMQNGKGLAVIDPHGDMAEAMLRHVPPERIKDVIYFNPDDLEYPIGLNLLELTPGLSDNELLREKDIITESVVSVFRKIFSDEDNGGHRIEYVLRNAIQTALTVENATLFTVFDLLNDPKYRKGVIKTLEDKNLINFWKNELGKAGDMQKVKMAAGITAKIGRFLFSASARQILEQPKSTIDFDDIINSGKILICNFSKGLIGEDTSELFGITVLAKLQLASLRRARLQQTERRPFYLYVDEFQNFATPSFVQMLSESRKYKLFMIMAEQSTSQQDDQQMVGIVLANVGTVICFRTGNPQDERTLLPLFKPYIEETEISNLPSFNFYARLSAVSTQEPLSGQTLLFGSNGSERVASEVIANSRIEFGHKQSEQVLKTKTDEQKLEPKQKASKYKQQIKQSKEAKLDKKQATVTISKPPGFN